MFVNVILLISLLLGACAQAPAATPELVKQTVIVKETQEVVVTQQVIVTATTIPTVPPVHKFSEAPMLADLVKAGKLPPVEERLPENPVVIQPAKETGKYGGELRFGFVGNSPEWGGMLYFAGWEHPVFWKPDFSGIVLNYAESLTANADASAWTMKLRKGIKWSDGVPFTADDIAFFIQDVLMNKELYPGGVGGDWLPGDMTASFSFAQVDDYTVILSFGKPYGAFPLMLASWAGRQFAMYPKHYLQQFHKAYNPQIADLMKKESVETWTALFFKKGPDTWGNPGRWFTEVDLPTLYAYVLKQPLGTGSQVLMERNPYYWKVDDKGNQLPYIDKLTGIMYQENQGLTLAMLNGDLDFYNKPGGNEEKPLFLDAIKQGKPLFLNNVLNDGANGVVLQFNMTNPDPVKAEVFSDINFRIGVSYSLNRQELIELFNDGLGYPSQVCPQPSSPLYIEQCNNQYIEFDKAKAQEYLDKVLTKGKDKDGFYLDKNGRRFSFVLIVINDNAWAPRAAELGEVLVGYMRAVGLDAKMNAMPNSQYDPLRLKNDVEAFISTGEGGAGLTALLDARNFVPMEFSGTYSNAWTLWRLKGQGVQGITGDVEPPQWVKDARKKYDEALSAPTEAEQITKMRAVVQEATDRFYEIGAFQGGESWYPFSSKISNVYDSWYLGWIEGDYKILYPEQWFLNQ